MFTRSLEQVGHVQGTTAGGTGEARSVEHMVSSGNLVLNFGHRHRLVCNDEDHLLGLEDFASTTRTTLASLTARGPALSFSIYKEQLEAIKGRGTLAFILKSLSRKIKTTIPWRRVET